MGKSVKCQWYQSKSAATLKGNIDSVNVGGLVLTVNRSRLQVNCSPVVINGVVLTTEQTAYLSTAQQRQ